MNPKLNLAVTTVQKGVQNDAKARYCNKQICS